MTTVVIAHDLEFIRVAVRCVLAEAPDIEIAAEACNSEAAVRILSSSAPDVLVFGFGNGNPTAELRAIRELAALYPDVGAVLLTRCRDEEHAGAVLRAGAAAYTLIDDGVDALVAAIRHVAAGRRYLSPGIADRLIAILAGDGAKAMAGEGQGLTERERQTIRLAAEGKTNAEIAQALFISKRTVEAHRAHAMRKLGLRNQSELVLYAISEGMLPLP
jgi:DNA-binding NarL/FixJ family response regulator